MKASNSILLERACSSGMKNMPFFSGKLKYLYEVIYIMPQLSVSLLVSMGRGRV